MFTFQEPVKQHVGTEARAEGQLLNLPQWPRICQVMHLLQTGLTLFQYEDKSWHIQRAKK